MRCAAKRGSSRSSPRRRSTSGTPGTWRRCRISAKTRTTTSEQGQPSVIPSSGVGQPHEGRVAYERRARSGLERPVLAEELEPLVAPLRADLHVAAHDALDLGDADVEPFVLRAPGLDRDLVALQRGGRHVDLVGFEPLADV